MNELDFDETLAEISELNPDSDIRWANLEEEEVEHEAIEPDYQ